jgi:hypothetical protein
MYAERRKAITWAVAKQLTIGNRNAAPANPPATPRGQKDSPFRLHGLNPV